MTPSEVVVSLVLMALPATDWLAAFVLGRAARSGVAPTFLRERARVAIILAVATTINATIAGLNFLTITFGLEGLRLDPSITVTALSVSLILPGVPNIYWLWLYYRSRRGSP